jgi:hypothetical protein
VTLPAPLGVHYPVKIRAIPLLLVRLATVVDYADEAAALNGIAREIALFAVSSRTTDEVALRDAVSTSVSDKHFRPPVVLATTERSLQAVVTVEALYKVFERC